MSSLNKSTAILLFSRNAEEESRHKDLFKGEKNKNFHQVLRAHAYKQLVDTGLPVFDFPEQKQVGFTFGERIANAFSEAFNKGFEGVIVVGSDCPELETADILKAVEALETNQVVLGPDLRGGVFLIGLQKSAFNRKQFIRLKWKQSDLLDSFISYGTHFNLHFLEAKFDLNFHTEILNHLIHSKKLQKLLKLAAVVRTEPVIHKPKCYFLNTIPVEYLRGPPHAA